jgi:hypothetical protein
VLYALALVAYPNTPILCKPVQVINRYQINSYLHVADNFLSTWHFNLVQPFDLIHWNQIKHHIPNAHNLQRPSYSNPREIGASPWDWRVFPGMRVLSVVAVDARVDVAALKVNRSGSSNSILFTKFVKMKDQMLTQNSKFKGQKHVLA